MSLKKLIPLLFIFVMGFSAEASANGNLNNNYDVNDVEYIPPPPVYSGLYIEAQFGYLMRDWEESTTYQAYINAAQGGGPPFGGFKNGEHGTTDGIVLGYQWSHYFGAEISWNRLARVLYSVPPGLPIPGGNTIRERSWMAYIALKFDFPITGGLYLISKAGAADVNVRSRFSFIPVLGLPGRGSFWAPIFAVGLQYYFDWNWSINAQYMHVNGYGRTPLDGILRKVPSPHSDMFTVGFGYKIAI